MVTDDDQLNFKRFSFSYRSRTIQLVLILFCTNNLNVYSYKFINILFQDLNRELLLFM